MFFDSVLLYRRHNGQLGLAWTAATRGVSLIKKRENIIKFDVVASCTVVMEYITSNSVSTKRRFSLRLSSILTNGITKIRARQAVLLFEDISRFLIAVVKPPEVMSFEEQQHESLQFDTPPTPLPVSKSAKRTRKPAAAKDGDWRLKIPSLHSMQVLTPLEEDAPQIVPPTVARWDDITIREADIGSSQDREMELDFGPPLSDAEVESMFQLNGRQSQIEIPKYPLAQLTQNISSEDLSCHQVVVEVDVHVPASSVDETPSPKRLKASHVERSSQLEVPQPVLQELYSEISPERRVGHLWETTPSAEVPEDIEGVIQTMPSTVSDEDQVAKKRKTSKTAAEVPSEDVAIRDARTKDEERKRNLNHFVRTHAPRTRAVNINRSLLEELDEPIILLPIEHIMRADFEFDLLPLYMTSSHDETFPEVVIGDGSTSMPSILVTPPVDGMRRSVSRRPSFETTPLRRHGDGAIHEKTIAEAEQLEEHRSPTESFEPAFVSVPPTDEPLLEPLENGQAIQSVEVPAVPLSVQSVTDEGSELIIEKWSSPRIEISDAVKVRHQVLLQSILKYDESAQIKFDDLIPPPPTKLNAARTFSDLLDLGKAKYVLLHTDTDESCILRHITRGPKLSSRH